MANQTIYIPGSQGVELNQNDTLTIIFRSPAKFCISQGDPNCFNPPLPVGVAEPKDYQYVGTAVCANATIKYSSVGHDQNCGTPNPREVPPGTIQIGTGTK